MSQAERNKGVVRASLDAADRGAMEAVRACFAPDYVDHSEGFGSRCGPDREGAMAAFEEFAPAFTELRDVSPTGREVTMTQTVIYRIHEGLIAERWVDGVESLVDLLRHEAGCPGSVSSGTETPEVKVLRGAEARWNPDPAGGEFWELALQGVSLTYFRLEAGASFPAHEHEAEQITLVLAGRLTFEFDHERRVLGPGEAIAVPAQVRHAVSAGKEAVVAVDAWSPPPDHLGPATSA